MAKTVSMTILSLALLAALGYFLTTGVVKPVSTDLSVIGQGKPVLVLAYENFSPTGGEALERLREVRADYDSRMQIVVADLGTPQGRSFANRFGVGDGQTVFLDPDGRAVSIAHVPDDEQVLRRLLNDKLAMLE